MKRLIQLILTFLVVLNTLGQNTYYVSTDGADGNPGTIEQPFGTWQKAIAVAEPGDLIYIRGGVYYTTMPSNNYIVTITKSGEPGKMIRMWAYPGEKVTLNCTGITNQYSIRGITLRGDYWHIKGIEVTGIIQPDAGGYGRAVQIDNGNHNIMENLNVHHNECVGFYLGGSSTDNLLINCDFHHNYDPKSVTNGELYDGGYADGCHISVREKGTVNTVKGCRFWYNSDDGLDLWRSEGLVVVDSCWSFWNGYKPDTFEPKGDGNGYKLGMTELEKDPTPQRIIRNCMAFGNRQNGFDDNKADVITHVYNCIAYENGRIGYTFHASTQANRFINNIAYKNSTDISINDESEMLTNSWDGMSLSDADFVTIDFSGIESDRNSDGSLPLIQFLRPVEGSDLVNNGTYVGIPYHGDAPDIGIFEYTVDNQVNNPPSVVSEQVTIADDSENGYVVHKIDAYDPDDDLLSFKILSGNSDNAFVIDSAEGYISITNAGILTQQDVFSLQIEVSDDGDPSLYALATITVIITHVQKPENHQPIMHDQEFFIYKDNDINSYIGTVEAEDIDPEQNLKYAIISGDLLDLFRIDEISGELYFPSIATDFYIKPLHELTIQVKDNGLGELYDTAIITIHLISQNTVYYIDPDNNSDETREGDYLQPYSSWEEVSWETGGIYLQKRGTASEENAALEVEASNVSIGAYGVGADPVINSTANDYAVKILEKSDVSIEDLQINAEKAIAGIYILGSASENISIKDCHIQNSEYGIRILDGKSFFLSHNTFSATYEAVFVFADYIEINYNNFIGNTKAINFSNSSTEARINNNVFVENETGIISSLASTLIYNNIFHLSKTGSCAFDHISDKFVSNNNIFYPEQPGFIRIDGKPYSSLSEYQTERSMDNNSFSRDPKFQDIQKKQLKITKESPAIDAGVFVGILEDMYGSQVPLGKAPDIGSYETNFISPLINDHNLGDRSIKIFPNPTTGKIVIQLPEEKLITEIEISDIMGRSLFYYDMSSNHFNELTIDLNSYPKGIYMIRTNYKDGRTLTEKVILE